MPYAVPNPLPGYRELNPAELQLLATIKAAERDVADVWRDVADADDTEDGLGNDVYVDARWLAVARTHLQEGFSALVRSVTRPDDPFEPRVAHDGGDDA